MTTPLTPLTTTAARTTRPTRPTTWLRRSIVALGAAIVVALAGASPAAAQTSLDRSPLTEIADPTVRSGRSTLLRFDDGAFGIVRTRSLVPGDAYTVWAVVFNNPAACDGPCDATDLANPDVEGVSTIGTGDVAARRKGTFLVYLPDGAALTDPHGAEIHFVIRTHGPAIEGLVEEQTSTLNGGCPPNTCANVQMAKHD